MICCGGICVEASRHTRELVTDWVEQRQTDTGEYAGVTVVGTAAARVVFVFAAAASAVVVLFVSVAAAASVEYFAACRSGSCFGRCGHCCWACYTLGYVDLGKESVGYHLEVETH